MGISPKTKAIIILVVILAVWIGGGVFLYFQIYQPSQSANTTTPYTQTTPTTTTTAPTSATTTTPASNLTQEEQAYIATISDHYDRTITAMTTISNLLAGIQLDSASWVSQATTQTEALKALYDEISQVSTPYSLLAVHYKYSYAISIYKSAAVTIEQAINEQNADQFEVAISYINSGTTILSEAINALNEFIAEKY